MRGGERDRGSLTTEGTEGRRRRRGVDRSSTTRGLIVGVGLEEPGLGVEAVEPGLKAGVFDGGGLGILGQQR